MLWHVVDGLALWITFERRGRMDPDTNLEEQRELSQEIADLLDAGDELSEEAKDEVVEKANRLVDLVQALDTWIMKKGFLPLQWKTMQMENFAPASTEHHKGG